MKYPGTAQIGEPLDLPASAGYSRIQQYQGQGPSWSYKLQSPCLRALLGLGSLISVSLSSISPSFAIQDRGGITCPTCTSPLTLQDIVQFPEWMRDAIIKPMEPADAREAWQPGSTHPSKNPRWSQEIHQLLEILSVMRTCTESISELNSTTGIPKSSSSASPTDEEIVLNWLATYKPLAASTSTTETFTSSAILSEIFQKLKAVMRRTEVPQSLTFSGSLNIFMAVLLLISLLKRGGTTTQEGASS
jgi:hypothetical protein